MTGTAIIEESRSPGPVLEQLSPTLEKQVAEIIEAAGDDAAAESAEPLNLGYSVPMPGVRYYSYL